MLQLSILILSLLAIFGITSKKQKWRYWGCIIGLISEVPWAISAYIAGQWGIGVLVVVYAFIYVKGMRNNYEKSKTTTLQK